MIPSAKKIPHEMTIHGHTRVDNYYWLNQRENPEVIEYLEQENRYFEEQTAHLRPLEEQLFSEIRSRIQETDMSVPVRRQGYEYYSRHVEGGEYPIFARKKIGSDVEEVLLDGNKMSEGFPFFHIGTYAVSRDNALLAYCVDYVSRRKYELRVKVIATGEVFDDKIVDVAPEVVWANDNKTLFYVKKDESLRDCRVMRHILGTKQEDDVEVFFEDDDTFNVMIEKSKSQKYIFISSDSTLSSEVRFLDADDPLGEFKVFHKREKDHIYDIGHLGDEFYIHTNCDGAKNFKLMKVSVEGYHDECWREVIAHRSDVLLEGFSLFKDYIVLQEREQGLGYIRVLSFDGKRDFRITFSEPTYTVELLGNPEFDTTTFRYLYESLVTPPTVYEYEMVEQRAVVLKRKVVLGGFAAENYESRRLFVPSHDGTLVPVSLVYKKTTPPSAHSPLLLYGYGSYGLSEDAYFSLSILSLLDRGFVYAIAHIRGGEEMGRQWYEDGKLFKKKNTFLDFIACGKYLSSHDFCAPEKLFARGGSAGGLLMGAIVNMAPSLWRGIIANVPFVDVVTTMLDDTIPLTTGEYDEWGNPNKKEYYEYMLSYSPYDNVEEKNYPAMLVTTGLHDSQVQYWEPAKWVAKMREMKTDKNPLFLKTDMESGHGGASGRFKGLKEIATEYAFILDVLNQKNQC